ncbi:MAG: Ldh family oxidoreductase [Planctomycetaceae bacterium]|nr:Ldh family oxidoreductase [Planctomycetaceae bacterium]
MPHPTEYPQDPEQEILVSAEDLQTLVADLFIKKSVFAMDANIAAARIVEADMRGLHSHGVRMMKWYLESFDEGHIDPRGQVLPLSETVAMATLDGSRALGQVAGTKAMQLAIEKARAVGTGTVVVKNSHHLGSNGVYVQLAIDEGMIGHCITSTGRASVAGYGTKERATSNHALAWGIPVKSGAPIVLDMACAEASWGKINALAQYGLPIPPGWALDAEGESTTDGNAAKTLLPAAGPRGFGLGIVSGVLAGALVGGRLPIARKRGAMAEGSQHYFSVIDPEKFVEPDRFYARIEEALTAMRELEPAPEFERVRIPGERQWENMNKAKTQGVPVHETDAETLKTLANKAGVSVPWD